MQAHCPNEVVNAILSCISNISHNNNKEKDKSKWENLLQKLTQDEITFVIFYVQSS